MTIKHSVTFGNSRVHRIVRNRTQFGCRSIVLAAILSAAAAFAQVDTGRVDRIFEKWDMGTSPGCSIAVIKDGKILFQRGYGMADLDHDIRISPATVFHVASISKQFTAAAIVLLAQDEKLSLDDPVRKFIPELPDFGVPVTIRHLIHHSSGLRDQWDLLGLAGWRYSLDLITDEDVLSLLSKQRELNFHPGDEHLYCNTGYTLLAQIVKRVSGQSFREFTTARIFQPLGMSSTHFRDDHAEVVKNQAYGYEPARNGTFRLSVTNFDTVGATSLLTTVEDLALWDENFYDHRVGGPGLTAQMLERGSLNDGQKLDYAFGLVLGDYRGLKTVDHGGADAGYRADLLRFPDQHLSVACLCNLANTNPSTLTRRIADLYLARQLSPPPPNDKAVHLSERQLTAKAGFYWDRVGDDTRQLTVRDGKLYLALADRNVELTPLSKTRFEAAMPPVELEFQSDSRLSETTNRGKPQRFEAVPAFTPTPSQLSEYAGDYRSSEIEALYRVRLEDGKLTLERPKFPPAAMQPVFRDLFRTSAERIRFVRDAQGRVSGLSLSTPRVYHLRFSKEPESAPVTSR